MKAVPPLADLFEQAGMSLPEYLGKRRDAEDAATVAAAEEK